MKAVKIRNVVFGEGIPKICIPLTDTDLKGLKQSVKAMKSAPFDFVEWRADFYQNIENPPGTISGHGLSSRPVRGYSDSVHAPH